MSKLNINRNIFLEKEELLRMQKFLGEDAVANQVLLDNTNVWGIVRTVFGAPSPDFLVGTGTNLGTVKIATTSKAVDKNKNLIYQPPIDNLSIPDDSNWYWIKISYQYNVLEEGECSINTNGEVTGTSTKFNEVVRGQASEVPVKIKFYKESGLLNNQIYEVVQNGSSNDSDTELLLTGGSFVNESGLKYIVIGSTPIGETLTSAQLEGLYFYDGCNIELIPESITETAPTVNYVPEEEFYIARVQNIGGTVTIQDKRTEFLTFNVEGLDQKLAKASNLSDLENVSEARTNLNTYSKDEINTILSGYLEDTGWKVMTKGAWVSSDGFTMKARRKSGVVNIVGRMKIPSTPPAGTILASINYSNFTVDAKPSTRIFYTSPIVENNEENKGVNIYIDETNLSTLNLIVINAMDTDNLDYYFNITFISN